MDNGQTSGEQQKRKRGRPPGSRKTISPSAPKRSGMRDMPKFFDTQGSKTKSSILIPVESTEANDEQLAYTLGEENLSPFSSLLRNILRHDRSEISRVAREMEVAENTIYRWMSGSSEPRAVHLKRLLEVLPEQRGNLTYAINQTFPGTLDALSTGMRLVPKDTYRRILDLITSSEDEDIRFWQVSQVIFEYALLHLDAERRGLAITYAKLMPPHADGIHSLREMTMRGNPPWTYGDDAKAKVYLGSTTLAGTAAMLQRTQVWSDTEEGRLPVEVDEHEQSACAVPLLRGSRIAGVLIVSSTQSDFFTDPIAREAVNEYALLLSIALRDQEFQPISLLHLRPMPDLKLQRTQIARSYANRILTYVRMHEISRRDAELRVQCDMELEFEDMGRVDQYHQRTKIERLG